MESRIEEIRRGLESIDHKDRLTLRDIQERSMMLKELRDIERTLYGPPVQIKRNFAPFTPLEDTLAEIRNHFAARRKQ